MNPNLFKVHCTWAAVDGKSIIEAVTWSDRSENSDIEESIQAENCLLLECSGGKNSECRLFLQCQPPYVVQQVTVLCEARLIELYGLHQEYLRTVRCQMVDEMEDMIVFKAEVLLEKPSSECSVKFTGLKSKTSMWLYGVVVHVDLPMLPTSVLLSAAQRFSAQHEQPPPHHRGQTNAQMMALMALLGQQATPAPRNAHHADPPPPQSPQQPYQQSFPSLPNTRLGPQSSQQYIAAQQNLQHKVFSNETTAPQMMNNHLPNQSEFESAAQTDLSNQTFPNEMMQMLQMMNQTNSPGNPVALFATMLQQMQGGGQAGAASNATELDKSSNPATSTSKIIGAEKTLERNASEPAKPQTKEVKEAPSLPDKLVETATEPVVPAAPEMVPEVAAVSEISNVLTTPVPAAAPSSQVNRVISEPLSEAVAVSKLSGAAVEQISESVVTNLDCSLENLEERLWGKVRNRLQEMEARILNRLEEMLDALREEDESEPRELQEDIDIDEEEEEALSAMDPHNSVLEI